MVPSLFLMSFELPVSVKESPDRIKKHKTLLLQAYSQKSKDQFYSLYELPWVWIFSPSNAFITDFNTDCSLVNIILCWLSSNLDLNSFYFGVDGLKFIIICVILSS